MRDEVRQGLKEGFTAVRRIIYAKYAEKRRVIRQKDKEKNGNSGGQGHQPPAKIPSFLDIVYNYFTDNNEQEDERDKIRKDEAEELKSLSDVRKKVLNEGLVPETDYQEFIEEKFEDKIGAQWAKEKQRLHELLSVICQQIRENLNQEDGTLCLAFLDHLVQKIDQNSPETYEKLWIEVHLLVNTSLKADRNSPMEPSSPISKIEEKKGSAVEYEVISNQSSSHDSLDHSNLDLTTDS